ncbi:hypothetical protein GGR56DRAFT_696898 [Xylariaceae sp. FL0804]|nr:hypothetical protein GGR56DRAFT_696898 [Xylariaceae sp. FL0804]
MDELDCSWPAWKFGMKREDLATKLHDQYNTIAFSIQDPDAFHHDVVEISHAACTTDEFHRLLDERKQLRLRELNDSLESASLEIISNPKLIGTQQWQLAVQLFRTRSFDSLVRYFSSYLPDDQGWQLCSVDPDCEPILDRLDEDIPVFIREPETLAMPTATSMHDKYLPPSPRSLTMCSDSSSTSCSDASSASSPARTSSPSASEADSDMMLSSQILLHHYEDDVSQPHDLDTPRTSISDISIPASEHWRTASIRPVVTGEYSRGERRSYIVVGKVGIDVSAGVGQVQLFAGVYSRSQSRSLEITADESRRRAHTQTTITRQQPGEAQRPETPWRLRGGGQS